MATKKKSGTTQYTPAQRATLTRKHNAIRADGRRKGQTGPTIGSRVSWATRKFNESLASA